MTWDDVAAFVVLIVTMVAIAAAGLSILGRRHSRAKQRLAILQQALEHPQLDGSTRREILAVLANEHEASKLRFLTSSKFWQRLIFGGGWVVFVFFGGMAVLAINGIVPRHFSQVALMWSLCGFAVMTLPHALRELTRRNRQLAD